MTHSFARADKYPSIFSRQMKAIVYIIVGQSEHYAEILIYRSAIWYMHTVQNAEFLQLLNYSWSVNVNS